MLLYAKLLFTPFAWILIAAGLGAIAAYPIFLLIDGAIPFHKVVSKTSLVLLILSTWPLVARLKLGASGTGLCPWRDLSPQLLLGFGYGLLILSVNLVPLFALDVRVLDPGRNLMFFDVGKALGKALAVGLVVAVIEEPLFRGALLGGIEKFAAPLFAITVSAFYYAALHFLRSTPFPTTELSWYSGLSVVADAFSNFANPDHIDSFLALLSVGLFLGCVRIRFRLGLGYCIGLHASWVFLIKATKHFTDLSDQSPWKGLVGNYNGIIGYPTAVLLLALAALIWRRKN